MNWAHYIIQVNIYLVIFYGFYKLLLDRETYFTLNRVYLIVAGGVSLAVPLLRFDWFANQPVAQPVYIGVGQLNQFVTQITIAPESPDQFNMVSMLLPVYVAGVAVFLCRFCYQLYRVKLLMAGSRKGAAFSFFNMRLVDEQLPGAKTISKHEEIHARQLHSADVLFFEALGVLTWFNPIIYFYKLTIKRIHEYLADEQAAQFHGDKDQYAMLLMSNALGVAPSDLINGFFNQKILKKRIFMLYKQRSRKVAILKYGLFVPLFTIALAASSASIRDNEEIIHIADKIQLENQLEMVQEAVDNAVAKVVEKSVVKINGNQADEDWATFYNFVQRSLRYPTAARTANVQGTSLVKFTLKKGEISDAGVVSRLGAGCDTEVLRTLLAYGDYDSITDGKYVLPVSFSIEGTKAASKPLANAKPVGYKVLNTVLVKGFPASTTLSGTVHLSEVNVKADASGKVYDFVNLTSQPSFPGGMEKFYQYVLNSIRYPQLAKDNKIQGKVFLSFVVETNGDLTDIKIDRKLGGGTDEETVRVLANSPRWIPGIQDGQKVRVKYNIPISFSLTGPTQPAGADGNVPAADVAGLLQRKITGLRITTSPDSVTTPIYIIDGVKQAKTKSGVNPLSSLKEDDIASIEILKDETAKELYKAEGQYGVIIVVTKAKAKKP